MKDMILRLEGSDLELIGVIVLNRSFYIVFYVIFLEGLSRFVKILIFMKMC